MSQAAGTRPGEITAQPSTADSKLLAPIWHSILLLLFIFVPLSVIPGVKSFLHGMDLWGLHLLELTFAWGLILFLHWGMTLHGHRLSDLLKGRWQEKDDLRDEIILGVQVGFLILVISFVMFFVFGRFSTSPSPPPPRTIFQLCWYLALGLTAGFGEELIFRGYLFRQIKIVTGNPLIALIGQAALFGLAHGFDQTIAGFLDKFISGLLFGCLAIARRSLLSSMVAHAFLDCVIVVLVFAIAST